MRNGKYTAIGGFNLLRVSAQAYNTREDIDHLADLVKHRLSAIGGVEKQETFLVLSTVKEDRGYALEPLFAGESREPSPAG